MVLVRRFRTGFCAVVDGAASVGGASGVASAKASLGDLAFGGDTAAAMVAAGGTMVGRLVSMTIRSGHLCKECRRMTVLSTSARAGVAAGSGMYQAARKSRVSNRLPTKAKYRPRGMPVTVVTTNPEVRSQRVVPAMVPCRRMLPSDDIADDISRVDDDLVSGKGGNGLEA